MRRVWCVIVNSINWWNWRVMRIWRGHLFYVFWFFSGFFAVFCNKNRMCIWSCHVFIMLNILSYGKLSFRWVLVLIQTQKFQINKLRIPKRWLFRYRGYFRMINFRSTLMSCKIDRRLGFSILFLHFKLIFETLIIVIETISREIGRWLMINRHFATGLIIV